MDRRRIVFLDPGPETGFEFGEKCFYVARLDAEKKPPAGREAHAGLMQTLTEANDPFHV